MTVRRRSRIWTRQPQVAVEIDWSNPITKDLAFVSTGAGPDAVSHKIPSVVGAGGVSPTINGETFVSSLGTNHGLLFDGIAPIKPTLEYTVISFGAPTLSGSRGSFFTQGDDGASPWSQYALLANAYAGSSMSGAFEFQNYEGGVN